MDKPLNARDIAETISALLGNAIDRIATANQNSCGCQLTVSIYQLMMSVIGFRRAD
jgi:hypothetical protein